MSKPPRRRMIPLFHKLVEIMIHEPHLTHEELGKKVGRSRHTISHIVTSDIFKYNLNKRREEYALSHQAAISYQLGRTMNAALKACADAIELGEANPRFALEVVKELKELTTDKPYKDQEHHSAPSVHISIGGDTIVRARERARIAHSGNAEIEDGNSDPNSRPISLIEGGAAVREESKQVPEE